MQFQEKSDLEKIKSIAIPALEKQLGNPPNLADEKSYKKWFTMILGNITMLGRDAFASAPEITAQLDEARMNWTDFSMSLDTVVNPDGFDVQVNYDLAVRLVNDVLAFLKK